ncbi:MAG: ABC transporter permease [Planctomycetia bacterium]|nr:ABC transporter permease [Planctomycetia bacterium]
MTRSELKLVGRLVLAQARRHPGRLLLTILATVASACIVVWVVSGYDSLVQQFGDFSEKYLGRYQAVVVPHQPDQSAQQQRPPQQRPPQQQRRETPALSEEVVASLRRIPAVATVDPVYQERVRVETAASRTTGGARLKSDNMPMLVGTDASEPPYALLDGKWIDPKQPDRMEGALSRGSAELLHVKLGDELTVSGRRAEADLRVRIVGIVDQPKTLPPMDLGAGMPSMRVSVLKRGPADAALYVPTPLAEKLTRRPARMNYAGIVLKQGSDINDFRHALERDFPQVAAQVEIQTTVEVESELKDSSTSKAARAQAYTATGISLLAALFIIFTTLSMGVHERIRQFAVLRAVGLSKAQIGAMVALESMLLGLIGWSGGLLAGWGLLKVAGMLRPDFLPAGAALGAWCIALSGACAFGGALTAAIIPAWRATAVRPLEAMAPQPPRASARFRWSIALIGLLLISINPVLMFFVPMPDTARYAVSAAFGCTSTAIGFLLFTPALIVGTQRLFGPVIARLLGLNSALLATQLSANLSRTIGTTVALSLGLGLFVAMQTWGYSMLLPFLPGDWMPQALVTMPAGGIVASDLPAIARVKGVQPDQCLPLAVEQTRFSNDLTGAKLRASITRQDNCILVGVDPQRALGGGKPMFDFRFVEGTRREAMEKLGRGRYCLVPDHFRRESGLGVGGKLALVPPNSPEQTVEYEIAGVVSMEGWHLLSKGGLRTRGARSAAMVFAPYDAVRHDFGIDRIKFLWLNFSGQANEEEVRTALQIVADRGNGANRASPVDQSPARPRRAMNSTVRIQTTASLRATTVQRADGIIWSLSVLPLVTLLVTSLGVVNTVLSSIRARRWELGVLRAVGVTRFGLIRLILAEALLIGAVACLLSLGFGVVTGYCGTEVSRYVDVHGGLITPLVIPWMKLAPGFGATLLLCLFAALGPAIATGRAEPLQLLQAGRGTG